MPLLARVRVRQAFHFCVDFQRKNEFRRLCDLLRYHLSNVLKYQTQANAIDLASGESLQLLLETRFEQFNTAAKMELWQEAFRAIEEIANLLGQSKKAPKPQMQAMFYQKLALVRCGVWWWVVVWWRWPVLPPCAGPFVAIACLAGWR